MPEQLQGSNICYFNETDLTLPHISGLLVRSLNVEDGERTNKEEGRQFQKFHSGKVWNLLQRQGY